jgi:3-hydroxyacyl-[acyl-carrier-protein] dehydratase
MRFNLVDRIVEVTPGRTIRTAKNLTLAEEYLADHFPTFPVMPGVLMLQTLVESGAWLLRISDDFRHSMIVLREAKNVKYGQFMEPGRRMLVTVELVEQDGSLATFKGKGEMEGSQTVTARFTLMRYNLRDRHPVWQATDERLVHYYRDLYTLLRGDPASQAGKPGPQS